MDQQELYLLMRFLRQENYQDDTNGERSINIKTMHFIVKIHVHGLIARNEGSIRK